MATAGGLEARQLFTPALSRGVTEIISRQDISQTACSTRHRGRPLGDCCQTLVKALHWMRFLYRFVPSGRGIAAAVQNFTQDPDEDGLEKRVAV